MTPRGTATGLLVTSGILLCISLLTNFFILEAIVHHQMLSSLRTTQTNELVIGSLSVVNIFNGVANFVWLLVYLLGLRQQTGGRVYQVLDFASMSTASTSFWFTASLSAFYTFKISSSGMPCLTHLKIQVPAAMPHVLLFLMLASSTFSALIVAYVNLKAANGIDLHCGDYYETSGAYSVYIMCFTALGFLLLLGILNICSILLVVSLYRHSRHMENSPGGQRTAMHLHVAKMVVGLLVFYTVCVVFVQLIDHLYVASGGNSLWFVTYSFVLLAYSAGCPFALSWGTVRLHRCMLKLWSCMRCCRNPVLQQTAAAATRPSLPGDAASCSPNDGKSIFMIPVS